MAITIDFNVNPFGYGAEPVSLGGIRIHSEGNDHHHYLITFVKGDGRVGHLSGQIKRDEKDEVLRSGHRNILHLLKDIFNDADIDSLGENYVDIFHEVEKQHPNIERSDVSAYRD